MNRSIHTGAVALACVGVLLVYAGWLGWTHTPARTYPFHCGDETCQEAHP